MKHLFRLLLISLSLVAVLAHAKVVDKIVAIVNDQVITMSDVEKFKKKLSTGGLVDEAASLIISKILPDALRHRYAAPVQRTAFSAVSVFLALRGREAPTP